LEKLSRLAGRTLVCAVTAAMERGTGLDAFARVFPDRFFELGIVEEQPRPCARHGKAGDEAGLCRVFPFLQRSYDLLMEDIGLLGCTWFGGRPAGVVGRDGMTHQGSFDLAYLGTIPA
jgi:1-deoxy-D-xylulose-5-phosphate synthase